MSETVQPREHPSGPIGPMLLVLVVVVTGGIYGCVSCMTPPRRPDVQSAIPAAAPQPPAALPEPSAADMQKVRLNIAKTVEETALRQGFDWRVRAQGKNLDVLRIDYALMSRPMVYQITHDEQFDVWRDAGFKRLICSDGAETWTQDMK